MKIWKLSPRDLSSPGWRNSDYQGDAIVRAENEKEARNIAASHFRSLSEKKRPCQETPRSPWDDPVAIECIELDNSNYSIDGPAGLLEPAGFAI
ncbi:hypothetical protein GH146_02400 [archaeon]|nr:hypothetical protein [archaeon]